MESSAGIFRLKHVNELSIPDLIFGNRRTKIENRESFEIVSIIVAFWTCRELRF